MALSDHIVCVSPLSKDLKGELDLIESEPEKCPKLNCKTLETRHRFRLDPETHECDSEFGRRLNGSIIGAVVHKFADADGRQRGIHEGSFRWRGEDGIVISGTMNGVTNAGTHREPAFDACQKCHDPGVMEGMLLGSIRRGPKSLVGCRVQAAFRLRFDADKTGGSGGTSGSLEGAVICTCPS
ncbi:MAG TPA: hypothetical protein VGW10_19780 [Solirubrobacteraceae bacterium]|nr:hypothetical protein [Solirubrobacteraceae bacterium]